MKLHHYDSILKHYEPHQGKYKEFWGISGSFLQGRRVSFLFTLPNKKDSLVYL